MDENEALAREHELYCLSGKPKLFQDGFNKGFHEGWQAAKADSAQEIVELEVHINRLSEALHEARWALHFYGNPKTYAVDLDKGDSDSYRDGGLHARNIAIRVKEALVATPSQSLKAHDNEIYERCATVCDVQARDWDSGSVIIGFNYPRYCANKIRALKGE